MDVLILSGNPTPTQAQVIERAFARLEAEAKADRANAAGAARDGWTLSGRLASQGAAAELAKLRFS
jgi:hypothetical protein